MKNALILLCATHCVATRVLSTDTVVTSPLFQMRSDASDLQEAMDLYRHVHTTTPPRPQAGEGLATDSFDSLTIEDRVLETLDESLTPATLDLDIKELTESQVDIEDTIESMTLDDLNAEIETLESLEARIEDDIRAKMEKMYGK
jgi:hypothetical protein